jgi:hypothetical protein
MQYGNPITRQIIKLFSVATCASVFTLFTAVSSQAGQREDLTPPRVPNDIQVPAEAELFLIGHAVGTQNYVCVPSGAGFVFNLFTPEATLFNDDAQQIITHFFSPNPNPKDGGAIRATWEHSRDTSTVWGAVTGQVTVRQDSIAWLRVEIKGAVAGPTGGTKLTRTKFVQRINTVGGLPPSTGCSSATDVGTKAFIPYTADYLFYKVNTQEQ